MIKQAADEESSQIEIAAFADAEQPLLPAGRGFAGRQADPGSKVPAFGEGTAISDGRVYPLSLLISILVGALL